MSVPAHRSQGRPCACACEQGDMARATVFNDDPADAGGVFEDAGLRISAHRRSRRRLRRQAGERARRSSASSKTIAMPVQLGGGIRDMATIEGWLDKGVDRVIIGTAAVRDPALVKAARAQFPGPRRGRARCPRRQGRGRRLGGDVGTHRARYRAALRGRRRRRHHLHRHRARRHAARASISTPPLRSPRRCRSR